MSNPFQKNIIRMESKTEEKFSELDEDIADLKKSVKCLQVKMNEADNDIGILSVNDSDLVRSVYKKHDSVMEEINHINDKINVMDKKINMMVAKIDDINQYVDLAHLKEIMLDKNRH